MTSSPLGYVRLRDFSPAPVSRNRPVPAGDLELTLEYTTIGEVPGTSYSSSVFNTMNVLVGLGLLAYPFALSNTGWMGLLLLAIMLIGTSYTALILPKCMAASKSSTFPDMGREAYGRPLEIFIGIVFFIELVFACSSYLIVSADNLHLMFSSVWPGFTPLHWILVTTAIVLPSTWLPNMSLLSYLSAFGFAASVVLFLAVTYTGFSTQGPGSITRAAAPTALFHWQSTPLAIGLFMSGFAGHAVFPNIYQSMKDRSRYPAMVATTYLGATLLYVSMACFGYLMYGDAVKEEITLNLPRGFLSDLATWMTIVNPMTKFALTLEPAVSTIETLVKRRLGLHSLARATQLSYRTAFTGVALAIAIFIPHFDRLLELIGSFCSFTVSFIFPCIVHLKLCGGSLSRPETYFNWVMITLGGVLALLGTFAGCYGPL